MFDRFRRCKRLAVTDAEMCPSWLKEHDWKSCKRVSVSRVRIPTSPPLFLRNFKSSFGESILYFLAKSNFLADNNFDITRSLS